jgi:hypothetical protein
MVRVTSYPPALFPNCCCGAAIIVSGSGLIPGAMCCPESQCATCNGQFPASYLISMTGWNFCPLDPFGAACSNLMNATFRVDWEGGGFNCPYYEGFNLGDCAEFDINGNGVQISDLSISLYCCCGPSNSDPSVADPLHWQMDILSNAPSPGSLASFTMPQSSWHCIGNNNAPWTYVPGSTDVAFQSCGLYGATTVGSVASVVPANGLASPQLVGQTFPNTLYLTMKGTPCVGSFPLTRYSECTSAGDGELFGNSNWPWTSGLLCSVGGCDFYAAVTSCGPPITISLVSVPAGTDPSTIDFNFGNMLEATQHECSPPMWIFDYTLAATGTVLDCNGVQLFPYIVLTE